MVVRNRHQTHIFFFEVADGDETRATANSEFFFIGAPLHTSRRAIDAENNQRWLPCASRILGPYICISVFTTRDELVGIVGPVDSRHPLPVLIEENGTAVSIYFVIWPLKVIKM